MTDRNIFGTGARLMGLYWFTAGLADFIRTAFMLIGIPFPHQFGPAEDLMGAIQMTAFGLILMFGANWITRLVYSRENSN